ncbi:hypothetical protein EST38_g4102 [Candolleomyces aberdarensis]|uniref:Uncharacterized protein n=1 Tax=Candolleomyces aberdarensis TaxID=2316362 RepID=A0A4Q2DQP7_9AGAR|nr:hypothetical protein EST38_g4102 [Candolleomyces aberdarensis]
MKSLVQWTALALAFAGPTLATLPARFEKGSGLPFVPNKFIIEVDNLANIPDARKFFRSLDAVYSSLRKRGVGLDVDKEFDSAGLFTGASVTLRDVATVENIPGVKAIRPVVKVQPPKPQFSKRVFDKNDPAVPADSLSTHVMTGVDKLHAEGLSGKGVKIGMSVSTWS